MRALAHIFSVNQKIWLQKMKVVSSDTLHTSCFRPSARMARAYFQLKWKEIILNQKMQLFKSMCIASEKVHNVNSITTENGPLDNQASHRKNMNI